MENAAAIDAPAAAGGGLRKAISALRGVYDRRRQIRTADEALSAEEARRRLFETEAVPHMDTLYNFALRMTGQEADAHDLVQETYLKAYRFFDRFEPGTNCRAWLFRIMKNSYINRYRRDRKNPDVVDYDSIAEFYPSLMLPEADPNDLRELIFGRLLGDEVTAAVEALPEDFRTVVVLCDIEGLTYEEIAEYVGCPVGTVRSRLHRGRKLLRESLLGYAQLSGYVDEPA
jgi:RNA polymerase sigma-70 factor (ECF subfamily)